MRAKLRLSADAVNGPTPYHDLGDACVFNTRRGSEDWSLAFRDAPDLAFMLDTLRRVRWLSVGADGTYGVTVDSIARAFTTQVGDSDMAETYGLPAAAAIPLRQPVGTQTSFGLRGPGMAALRVPHSAVTFGTTAKAKLRRFPLLCEPSSNVELAKKQAVRFEFIKVNQKMSNPSSQAGVIRRLKVHVADVLQHSCWNLSSLAAVGTVIADVNNLGEVLETPHMLHRAGGSGEGWWKEGDRAGDWSLRQPYDTADGPSCMRPLADQPTRLRLLDVLTLGCAGRAAGAHLRVEEYSAVVQHPSLPLTDEGFATMAAARLVDPKVGTRNSRKRAADIVLARTSGGSPGPEWPSRADWKVVDAVGNTSGVIWLPVRRLRVVTDDGKTHVLKAVKVWADRQAEYVDSETAWDMVDTVDGEAAPVVSGRRTRGPRVDVFSREVKPPHWVTVPVRNNAVSVPAAFEARNRLMRRLEADAEEALRCEALMPDSMNEAYSWYRSKVESYRANGRRPPGFELVYNNLNGHMAYYATFLIFLEFAFDIRCAITALPGDHQCRGVFDPPCNPPTPAEGSAHGQSP